MEFKTREEWLMAAVDALRSKFAEHGLTIPAKVKVACGWTIGNRKKVAGEMWVPTASKGEFYEVFISPVHDGSTVTGSNGVLETLVHELIHTAIYPERGHRASFKQAMKKLGLEGPAKSTSAGTELCVYFETLVNFLGPYPHSALELSLRDAKKQSTRLIKIGCPNCDYVVRVTRVHLEKGTPICPVCNEHFVEQ